MLKKVWVFGCDGVQIRLLGPLWVSFFCDGGVTSDHIYFLPFFLWQSGSSQTASPVLVGKQLVTPVHEFTTRGNTRENYC
jgi:hypothetical protein